MVGAVGVINGICKRKGASLGLSFADTESCGWSDGNNGRADCGSSGSKEFSSAAYSGDELISYNMGGLQDTVMNGSTRRGKTE